MLEDTIARRFDYREMSKRALASHWSRLTDEERTEFVNVFKGFLSDRYASKIEGYSGEKIHYLSERLEGEYAEVRTKLISSKVEYPMDYRMINKAGRWYAYDIVADGVSLVRNYRSQFEKILKTGSYEELVSRLKDHSLTHDSQH
jgi:phospholipid transport system substrate-binding protein